MGVARGTFAAGGRSLGMRRLAAVLALAVLAAACGDRLPTALGSGAPSLPPTATANASATAISGTIVPITPRPSGALDPTPIATAAPTPSPTLTPAVSGALTLAQLKYRIFDRFGRLWYCDPDFYPVARSDADTLAEQRFPEVQADSVTFAAILAHLGYAPSASYTHEQKVAIYVDWKMLGAFSLVPAGGAYRFTARFTANEKTGSQVDGTIDASGGITVTTQTPTGAPPCPICLARGTRIATPAGSVAVEDVADGMIVWSMDAQGRRIAAIVERVGSMTAPADHVVVHLILGDGRELRASPAHPLADGRPVGSLIAGDQVDGSLVVAAEREPYGLGTTFDLLPASPTGVYWADGIPLGSTIAR